MSGYIESSRYVPVNDFVDWNMRYGSSKTNPASSSSIPLTGLEYLLTFRSGGRYEAEINNGAIPVPGYAKVDLLRRTNGDTGHEFDHRKMRRFTTQPKADITGPYGRFIGPLFLEGDDAQSLLPRNVTDSAKLGFTPSQLNVFGATAISRAYPTKPQADTLVAVAELLREGLPSALFSGLVAMRSNSKRELLRTLSGDYLNYIFGVSPLVREANKLIETVQKVNTYITQLAADSGRVVRRARTIEETSTYLGSRNDSQYPNIKLGGGGVLSIHDRTPMTFSQTLITKVWYAGAFQYWIPNIQSSETGFQSVKPGDYATSFDIAGGVYGLRVTPKAAWNLLPFSWLVDWFLNVGVLFENVDAMTRYGLVQKYGYVMAQQTLVTTTTANFGNSYPGVRGSVSSSVVISRQQRAQATPYGFGLKDVDLNPVQLSIIAAVGLSAGRR